MISARSAAVVAGTLCLLVGWRLGAGMEVEAQSTENTVSKSKNYKWELFSGKIAGYDGSMGYGGYMHARVFLLNKKNGSVFQYYTSGNCGDKYPDGCFADIPVLVSVKGDDEDEKSEPYDPFSALPPEEEFNPLKFINPESEEEKPKKPIGRLPNRK